MPACEAPITVKKSEKVSCRVVDMSEKPRKRAKELTCQEKLMVLAHMRTHKLSQKQTADYFEFFCLVLSYVEFVSVWCLLAFKLFIKSALYNICST